MKKNSYIFSSESVAKGHPDKVADQISDALLDAHLKQDPNARCALETLCTTNFVLVAGEVSSKAVINYEQEVRECLRRIGYTKIGVGFDAQSVQIQVRVHEQSVDIARGVLCAADAKDQLGAGDQGLMFGYACNESEECMPLSLVLARTLLNRWEQLRLQEPAFWLQSGVDGKSQVALEYDRKSGKPIGVQSIVMSLQHAPEVKVETLREAIIEQIIKPALPQDLDTKGCAFFINPAGPFIEGGPAADCGLTGRKIVVDTYGGAAPHGGGAFSGKDGTKVDRSAAYGARWVAKSIVKSGLAERCLVQLCYAIGRAHPTSVLVQTNMPESNGILERMVQEHFDLRPQALIEALELKTPFYEPLARSGHFGASHLPWERAILL